VNLAKQKQKDQKYMAEASNLGLNNPLISKRYGRSITRRPAAIDRRRYDNMLLRPRTLSRPAINPQDIVKPATRHETEKYSRLQKVLVGLAIFILFVGLFISLQAEITNKKQAAQVVALSKKQNGASVSTATGDYPSTTKPSSHDISSYQVAPDLARYIQIPKLNVFARVMQVGLTSNGAIGVPNNVYDTAWYSGSAKPGATGATVIDGHVSGWATKGVFYHLANLLPG